MDFDIRNDKPRKVKCIRNDADVLAAGCNSKMLTIGKEYTVKSVEVFGWYTLVKLEEFPNIDFNSVLFEECE